LSIRCSLRWFGLLGLLAFALPAAAQQSERILDYHSDIQVQDDGTLLVRETIAIRSAGDQIRHGIFRDFPTRYADRYGNKYVVGFEVLGATRDASPEDFRLEDRSNGKRIYLGRSGYTLPPGNYTYTLTYTTSRQLGFFSDHDELFWNVTGNGWAFPIDRAAATVRLPERIPRGDVRLSGYTGPQGSMVRDLRTVTNDDGSFGFAAEHPLAGKEGLTIVLSWPKGYLAEPTAQAKLRYFLQDNRVTFFAGAGFLVILLYYAIVWTLVGRDPAPGTLVALYEPPSGLSPAAMRFLVRMGYDNKVFTSAILSMAAKGYLKIKEADGEYTLTIAKAGEQVLSADEKAAAAELFHGRTSIQLHSASHVAVSAAIKALKNVLRTAEEKIYFFTNGRYLIPGIVLSVLLLVAVAFSGGPEKLPIVGFMCIWLSGWSVGVAVLVIGDIHAWRSARSGGSAKGKNTRAAVTLTLFTIPFLLGEIVGIGVLAYATSVLVIVLLLATALLHVAFHYLLKAPTRAGRGLLDKVDGFKMFLGEVDADRMNRVMPPEKTPEVFEKFLPYALALGVEHAWAEKFSGILDEVGRTPGSGSGGYSPSFYSGAGWSTLGAAGFASAMSNSFSNAISSSSSAPGSSSGGGFGGGGGGSGGGGGGGGGGGW
jgi:hypothetical protein